MTEAIITIISILAVPIAFLFINIDAFNATPTKEFWTKYELFRMSLVASCIPQAIKMILMWMMRWYGG